MWNDHGDKQTTVITAGRSPSSGTTVRVTTLPASLISWTMSLWESSMMERPLTAEMRSPTCSRPQRSVGLPSMIRPILCGMTERAVTRRNVQLRTRRDDDGENLEIYPESQHNAKLNISLKREKHHSVHTCLIVFNVYTLQHSLDHFIFFLKMRLLWSPFEAIFLAAEAVPTHKVADPQSLVHNPV